MAANNFATMLHRKTNKVTVILVYTILEWILIGLLLLNSFFWYLITVFADYFGLKPPCVWCTRVDHILNSKKGKTNSHVCEKHCEEISKLAYCSSHGNLAESDELCEDCSSSRHIGGKIVTVSLVEEISNDSERNWRSCSCCKLNFSREVYSPYVLIKPSWDVLDYPEKENLIEEAPDESGFLIVRNSEEKGVIDSELEHYQMFYNGKDCLISCKEIDMDEDHEVEFIGDESKMTVEDIDDVLIYSDASIEHIPRDNFVDHYDNQEFTVELINNTGSETHSLSRFQEFEGQNDEVCVTSVNEEQVDPISNSKNEVQNMDLVENQDSLVSAEDQNSDIVTEVCDQAEIKNSDVTSVSEEKEFLLAGEETKSDSIVGEETSHQESTYYPQVHEPISAATCPEADQPFSNEDAARSSCTSETVIPETGKSLKKNNEVAALGKNMFVARDEQGTINHNLSIRPEINYMEEDKVPETPTYIGYLHHLQKKFSAVLDKKEPGAEESMDGGSLISEVDSEGVLTSDRLQSAMRALYAELEEERTASMIAANETMAMITRLQEEKATMEMEALHYQRMMEEQSEYDQEALQLLNELMLKREKEKQELEEELEIARNKILYYETKVMTTSKSSSTYGDELSIGHDCEGVDEYAFECYEDGKTKNTSKDAVLDLGNMLLESAKHLSTLHESLANFEEERQSILDQLKALEGKLFTPGEDEEEHIEERNGFDSHYENGHSNGFSDELDGKNNQVGRIMGLKAKKLLPLFDAVANGNANESENENENEEELLINGSDYVSSENKHAIEEEVAHLYERLQALEADREFLNHCVNSFKKGDKGMDLLQEILQHLRDLRSVELHAKNSTNGGHHHIITEIYQDD